MDKSTYEKVIEVLVQRIGFIEWQYVLEQEENKELKKKLRELEEKNNG